MKTLFFVILILSFTSYLEAQTFLWEKTYQIDTLKNIYPYQFIETQEEYLVISGTNLEPETGLYYPFLFKVSKSGEQQWYNILRKEQPVYYPIIYESETGSIDLISNFVRAFVPGYYGIFCFFIEKIDKNGNSIFNATDTAVSNSSYWDPSAMIKSDSSNYIAVSNEKTKNNSNIYVSAKYYDNYGRFITKKFVDSISINISREYIPKNLIKTSDNGYFMYGSFRDTNKNIKYYSFVSKFDSNFQKEWTYILNDMSNYIIKIFEENGNLYVFGYYSSSSPNTNNKFIKKFDFLGKLRDTKILNSNSGINFNDLVKLDNNTYIVIGNRYDNIYPKEYWGFYYAKFDENFELIYEKTIYYDTIRKCLVNILQDKQGVVFFDGYYDEKLFLSEYNLTESISNQEQDKKSDFTLFPNPSYSGHEITLQIPENISGLKISLYNSLGSLLDTHTESDVSPGQRTINYKPAVELSSGTYWIRVETFPSGSLGTSESWCKPVVIIDN